MESLLVVLVGFMAAVGVALCVTKPRYAIVPVLLLFPLEQILMGYIPDLKWKYSAATNIIVGLIAVFGVAYKFFRGDRLFVGTNNTLTWLILSLYAYAATSILWSPSPDSALFFLAQSAPYFVLMYLVTPLLPSKLDDLVSINLPMILTSMIIMALMLINPSARFINDRYTIDLGYVPGLGTVSSNPLAIADAGATLAIIAALYRPNKPSIIYTLIRWTGILLGLSLALLSGSRGQVLAGVAIIALFAPFATGSKNVLRVLGSFIIVGLAVGFLLYVYQNFVIGIAQSRWTEQGSAQGLGERWEMATTSLSAYGSNPAFWLIGLGASAFNYYFTYRPEGIIHWYPHNIAIEALTEYGVIGFATFSAILLYAARDCLRLVVLSGTERSRRSTAIILAAIIFFQLLMSLKQGNILGMPLVFMYCLILGRVTKNEQTAAATAFNLAASDEMMAEECETINEDGWAPSPDAV